MPVNIAFTGILYIFESSLSGIGGIRTRVQTPIEKDFYMLSLLLFVGQRQEVNKPIKGLAGWS